MGAQHITVQTEILTLPPLPREAVVHATRHGIVLAPRIDAATLRTLIVEVIRLARVATGTKQTTIAWLGDALANAPSTGRGWIAECAAATGIDPGTLRNAKMVCTRIPVSCRHDALSWSHHCEVGLMFSDRAEIVRWLALAEAENLSTGELRRRIRADVAVSARGAETAVNAEAFELMRDLRSVARLIGQRRQVWGKWSPAAAHLALAELAALSEFVDQMRARAIHAPLPSDPSLN